jgi:hypothetical protein
MELYVHSPRRLHGTVINKLSTGRGELTADSREDRLTRDRLRANIFVRVNRVLSYANWAIFWRTDDRERNTRFHIKATISV